jgi:hypothetical protein
MAALEGLPKESAQQEKYSPEWGPKELNTSLFKKVPQVV